MSDSVKRKLPWRLAAHEISPATRFRSRTTSSPLPSTIRGSSATCRVFGNTSRDALPGRGHELLGGGHALLGNGHVLLEGGQALLEGGHALLEGGHALLEGGHAVPGGGQVSVDGGHVVSGGPRPCVARLASTKGGGNLYRVSGTADSPWLAPVGRDSSPA